MASIIEIPGDVGALEALARQLRVAAEDVSSVESRVATNALGGSWSGVAASAFQASLDKLPEELDKIVAAFDLAGGAISTFASQLSQFQEKAHWINAQAASVEQRAREAQARERESQSHIARARREHVVATDPFSLASATSALEEGERLFRRAFSDGAEASSDMGRLGNEANVLLGEYNAAVKVCCNEINAARTIAGQSFITWAGNHVHGLVESAEAAVATIMRDAAALAEGLEKGVEDAANWALKRFDESWKTVRAVLEGTTQLLGEVTLAADIVIPIVMVAAAATGVGLVAEPELLAFMGVLNETNTVVGEAGSVAVLAGDDLEAARGNKEAQDHLAGDVVHVGTAFVPGDKMIGGVASRLGSVPALKGVVNRVMSIGEKQLPGAAPFLIHKEVHAGSVGAWQAISKTAHTAADHASPTVKSLITLPLREPSVFMLPILVPTLV